MPPGRCARPAQEADRACARSTHLPVVDAGQRSGDLLLGRTLVRAVVVQVTDAGVGDVEGAMAHARKIERSRHDVDDLRVHLDRLLEGARIHGGELALRLVGAHQFVGAAHFGDHRSMARVGERRVLRPEPTRPRAHDPSWESSRARALRRPARSTGVATSRNRGIGAVAVGELRRARRQDSSDAGLRR
jgi:hypothetical protein